MLQMPCRVGLDLSVRRNGRMMLSVRWLMFW
jgi:hypothetical protein